MLTLLRKKPRPLVAGADAQACAALAGELFDRGNNCTQAVLQAVSGRNDPEFLAMAEGFGGGIGDSGCLCGAVTGGVWPWACRAALTVLAG